MPGKMVRGDSEWPGKTLGRREQRELVGRSFAAEQARWAPLAIPP